MRHLRSLSGGFAHGIVVGVVVTVVVMLALPVVATVGGNFILGKANTADATTALSGASTVTLRLTNTQAGAPALDLRVVSGAPPLRVNSMERVANLNADRLDGKHASAFLLTTGTAANSGLLDGLDSTAFSLAGHSHAGAYLPVADKAADADLLDGLDATAFSLVDHTHDAGELTAGTLAESRFSAYSDLGLEGYLNNDGGSDLLTRSQADARFLGLDALASDSDRLDGQHASAFAPSGHDHDASYVSVVGSPTSGDFPILTVGGELADSAWGPASFAATVHAHNAADVTAGTLSESRYSAYSDLGLEGFLNDDAGSDLLTRSQADDRFLGAGGIAVDSGLLDGLDSTAFAAAGHSHAGLYLLVAGQAADANLLDGRDSSSFAGTGSACAPGASVVSYGRAGRQCSSTVGAVVLDTGGGGGGYDSGKYPSLALDALGVPVISYFDENSGDLELVHCGNPTCTAGNVYRTLSAAGQGEGKFTSLVLDASGFPVIAYYDTVLGDLELAHCTDATCAGKTVATVDSGGVVGQYTSLALDASGFPVIAYYDVTNGDLKVAHCADAACGAGTTVTTVDSGGDVGQYASMMLNLPGWPVVSYFDATNGDLKVARCGNATCGSGTSIQTVDSAGWVGLYTSLALDIAGKPVVSYYEDGVNYLKVVHCGTATCGSGNTITYVQGTYPQVGGPSESAAWYTSLVLDASGRPVVSYYEANTTSLHVVHCGDANCTSGNLIARLDTAEDVGQYTSLVLDPSGHPVIAYYDATYRDLKLAMWVD
jgi:hypothetical protein